MWDSLGLTAHINPRIDQIVISVDVDARDLVVSADDPRVWQEGSAEGTSLAQASSRKIQVKSPDPCKTDQRPQTGTSPFHLEGDRPLVFGLSPSFLPLPRTLKRFGSMDRSQARLLGCWTVPLRSLVGSSRLLPVSRLSGRPSPSPNPHTPQHRSSVPTFFWRTFKRKTQTFCCALGRPLRVDDGSWLWLWLWL